MKNINKFFVPVIALAVLVPMFALGATLEVGDEVFIKKGNDTRDNLYVAGGNVSVGSVTFGDALLAGGNVLVSKNVSEDIFSVGGSITILGNSGGDVRIVGGNILIAGDAGGDMVAVGGAVVITSDVSVGKDLLVAGGDISIDGDIFGDVQVTGGTVTINGHVRGDVKAKVGEHLTIGDGAVIDGDLEYGAQNAEALEVNEGAVVRGETIFEEAKNVGKGVSKNFLFAAFGALVFFKLISFIAIALLFVWLFKGFSNSVVSEVVKNPLPMLGKGFITLIVVPASTVVLFMTLLGVPLAVMVILSYIVLLLVTGVYAGVVVGAWGSQYIQKTERVEITWKNVVGGVVLLTVVKLIPVIGWIAGVFIFLVTLGSLADMLHKKLWGNR